MHYFNARTKLVLELRACIQCGGLSMRCIFESTIHANKHVHVIYIHYCEFKVVTSTGAKRRSMGLENPSKENALLHHSLLHLLEMIAYLTTQPVYKLYRTMPWNIQNCTCTVNVQKTTHICSIYRRWHANSVIAIRSSNLLKSCELHIPSRITCYILCASFKIKLKAAS